MLIEIPNVLDREEVEDFRRLLASADWVDGRITAGHQSAQVKANLQLRESSETAQELGQIILAKLEVNPLFLSAALPARVFPPLFNRYGTGMGFGNHVDNAIRTLPQHGGRIRTDLSATLFLSDPEEYQGGELLIEDRFGVHSVKLPAGSLALYPSSSIHRVSEVTQGERVASFFWIESMIRDDGQRTLLLDLDTAVQGIRNELPDHPTLVSLTSCYHNLLRMWGQP